MESVTGIYRSTKTAAHALTQLERIGVSGGKTTLLCPGDNNREFETRVPVSDTESPGVGEALAGTVGGAIGAAGGAALGTALASLFIPGVGPILASGIIAAALFGTGGALAGVAAGHALEDGLAPGVPHDELFIYEDALRKGRCVVVVIADTDDMAAKVRNTFEQTGAESINAARDDWWLGLRPMEEESYESSGGDFARDEVSYRRGFEASLYKGMRGRPFDEAVPDLKNVYAACNSDRAFRLGYERGYAHQRKLEQAVTEEKRVSTARGSVS